MPSFPRELPLRHLREARSDRVRHAEPAGGDERAPPRGAPRAEGDLGGLPRRPGGLGRDPDRSRRPGLLGRQRPEGDGRADRGRHRRPGTRAAAVRPDHARLRLSEADDRGRQRRRRRRRPRDGARLRHHRRGGSRAPRPARAARRPVRRRRRHPPAGAAGAVQARDGPPADGPAHPGGRGVSNRTRERGRAARRAHADRRAVGGRDPRVLPR